MVISKTSLVNDTNSNIMIKQFIYKNFKITKKLNNTESPKYPQPFLTGTFLILSLL